MPQANTINFTLHGKLYFKLTIDEWILLQSNDDSFPTCTDSLIEDVKAFRPQLLLRTNYEMNPSNPMHTVKDNLTTKESLLLKFIMFNFIENKGSHEELASILSEHADDSLLILLAVRLAEAEETLSKIPEIFSLMVARIIDMKPDAQDFLFEGNVKTVYNPIMDRYQNVYSDVYHDKHLNKGEFGLARLIHKIHLKSDSLYLRGEVEAADAAKVLYVGLSDSYRTYLSSDNKVQALAAFKAEAKQYISEARNILEVHRGWKNMLANLMMHIGLLVTTAGIGNVVALGVAYSQGNKHLLFPLTDTDSIQKINYLDDSLMVMN